jgi:hypothetical protein
MFISLLLFLQLHRIFNHILHSANSLFSTSITFKKVANLLIHLFKKIQFINSI